MVGVERSLFEDLQREGYCGAYDSLVRFARAFHQSADRPNEAFAPLSFDPGEAYQFGWSHEVVDLGGISQKIKVAHFRLSYSRKLFVAAYRREPLEIVLDVHMRALAFIQGIPQKVIIDNPKPITNAMTLWSRGLLMQNLVEELRALKLHGMAEILPEILANPLSILC